MLMRATTALMTLLAIVTVGDARAAPGPGYLWRTFETRHCNVHFHTEVEKEARHIASMCDDAIEASSTLLRSAPREKTEVIVIDTDDRANGFARTVPYNLVTILTIAPDGRSELSHTEDHLRLVLFHEMFHVVHLETYSGVPEIVNRVLGKSWPPNLLQPRFVVEGLAVFTESRVSDGGRLRTERFTAPLRVAALADDLWSLDDLANFSRRPPAGSAAYVYGGAFMAWLASRYGEKLIADQAHEAGGHLIPYGLQRSFEASGNLDFGAEYALFLDDVRANAHATLARVRARGGPSPARRLTRMGGAVSAPRFDANGGLLFVADPPNEVPGVFSIAGLPTALPTALPRARAPSPTGVAPIADGRIVFTRGETNDGVLAFQDLFLQEHDGSVRVLTRGARLRDPWPLPGGDSVVVERRSGGRAAVATVDVESGRMRDLLAFEDGTQVYTPRPSPDGESIVFSRLVPGGRRTLVEFKRSDGTLRELWPSAAEDADPSFTPDGRFLLFSSNRHDGVFNIFARELATGRLYRVTDTVGLASQPISTPDGQAVVYVDITIAGPDLYVAPLLIDDNSEIIESIEAPAPIARARTPVDDEPRIYNPLPSMLPRTWAPLLSSDQTGASALGLSLAGEDAVGLFAWSLQGSYGTGQMRPRFSGSLRFDGPVLPLSAFAEWRTDDTLIRTERDVDVPVRQTVLRANGSVSIPLRRVLRSHGFSIGYTRSVYFDETPPPGAPDGPRPRTPPPPNVGSVALTWTYSDIRRFRDSVSGEDGQSIALQLSGANALSLSPLNLYEIAFAARVYRPVPGLSRHVVSLLVEGGFAQGERLRRTNFRLGGIADRDFTRDIISQVRFGDGILRGYAPFSDVGDAYYLASVEYRVPILEIERGIESLPLQLGRIQGVIFADVGDAFDGVPSTHGARAGVGAELQARFTLAYYGLFFLRVGYARGLMVTGTHQPYVVLGVPL
jgi:Tol biopolymer transport system component